MLRFSIFLPLLAVKVVAFLEPDVELALDGDDQCANSEDSDCALNALQVRSLNSEADDADIEEEEDDDLEEESEWLKDISITTKNRFKHILTPLQRPIVFEYQQLKVLGRYATYTMQNVENSTGTAVLWNEKSKLHLLEKYDEFASLLQEDEDEQDEVDTEKTSRRRGSKSLPPRAAYVDKLIIYLEKEMKAVWNVHTMVDRKRWGIGNTLTSMPYGSHGEHPDRWVANGTFPKPLLAPPLEVANHTSFKKVKSHSYKYTNKYAERLQEDYANLISNINDAETKIGVLRKALVKMNGLAEQFMAAPSGVFNRMETQ